MSGGSGAKVATRAIGRDSASSTAIRPNSGSSGPDGARRFLDKPAASVLAKAAETARLREQTLCGNAAVLRAAAAELRLLVEDRDVVPFATKAQRRRDPAETCADDDRLGHVWRSLDAAGDERGWTRMN